MDPLSAVSLACNVTELLKTCKTLYKVYQGFRGGSDQLETLRSCIDGLDRNILSVHANLREDGQQIRAEQKELYDFATKCAQSSRDLKAQLDVYIDSGQGKAKSRRWDAIVATARYKMRISELDKQFEVIKTQQSFFQTKLLVHLNQQFACFGLVADTHAEQLDAIVRDLASCLEAIKQDRAEKIAKERGAELQRLRDEILKSLFFPEIKQREEQISEAYQGTFEWIFERKPNQPWDSFPDWLRLRFDHRIGDENRPYWISGKAGSGKSTLMRWLLYHTAIKRLLLDEYGSQKSVIMLSHFFFSPGNDNQKTIGGMLRALLYQLLEENLGLEKTFASGTESLHAWTTKMMLEKVLELLTHSDRCIYVMWIDGLDECIDLHEQLLAIITSFSRLSHIKIVVSSRPEVDLKNHFEGCPSLRLQDLTREDLSKFFSHNISEARAQAALKPISPSGPIVGEDDWNQLSKSLVDRANGIFLWAKVIMKSIARGIRHRDPLSTLYERMDALPNEVDEMFRHMLQSIETVYRQKAAEIFTFRLSVSRPLLVAEAVLLEREKDSNGAVSITQDVSIASDDFIEKLHFLCGGLLEVRPYCVSTKEGGPQSTSMTHRIEFIHRGARDCIVDGSIDGARHPLNFVINYSEEELLSNIIFVTIRLIYLIDDPLICFHLIDNGDLALMRYLRRSQRYTKLCRKENIRKVYDALKSVLDHCVRESTDNVDVTQEGTVFANKISTVILNYCWDALPQPVVRNSRYICHELMATRVDQRTRFPCKLDDLLLESGLAIMLPDSSFSPSLDATSLLISEMKAFGKWGLKYRSFQGNCSRSHVDVVETLLRIGADANCRITSQLFKPLMKRANSSWYEHGFSPLDWCMLYCEDAAKYIHKDNAILPYALRCIPLMECLVRYGAEIPTKLIHFRARNGLQVFMNFTAFVLYVSTNADSKIWLPFATSVYDRNPVVVCDLFRAIGRAKQESQYYEMDLWHEYIPARHLEAYFTSFYCDSLEEFISIHRMITKHKSGNGCRWHNYVGSSENYSEFFKHIPDFVPQFVLRCPQVIINPYQMSDCPYQPTNDEVVTFNNDLEAFFRKADSVIIETLKREKSCPSPTKISVEDDSDQSNSSSVDGSDSEAIDGIEFDTSVDSSDWDSDDDDEVV